MGIAEPWRMKAVLESADISNVCLQITHTAVVNAEKKEDADTTGIVNKFPDCVYEQIKIRQK